MEGEKQEETNKKQKSWLRRLGHFGMWVLVSIIALIIILVVLIQFPPVQNFAKNKLVAYLQKKLQTEVSVERLRIDFPNAISLQKVFVADRAADTLLYGGEIAVDIRMFRLLKGEVSIGKVHLDEINGNIYRQPPDSTFNFQFIIDAFSDGKEKDPNDTSSVDISMNEIEINRSRFRYKDLYSGNDLDVDIDHFQTTFREFNLGEMKFDIGQLDVKGLRGHFYQLEPIDAPAIVTDETQVSDTSDGVIQLSGRSIRLADIDFQFNSDPAHLKSSYVIGEAELIPQKIDLDKMIFAMEKTSLAQSDITIQLNSGLKAPLVDTVTQSDEPSSLQFISKQLSLKNTGFKMDDDLQPQAVSGMDFSHLHLTDMNLEAEDLLYSADTMRAKVRSANLKEQSGLVLQKMHADFEMNPTGVTLDQLLIETPTSEIQKHIAITYPSLAAISEQMDQLGLDVNLDKTTVSVADLLLFAPQLSDQLASFKNQSLYINTELSGTMKQLSIKQLQLRGLSGTDIDLRGSLANVTDPNKTSAHLTINKLNTNKRDIMAFLPEGTLPDSIQLPSRIAASGTIDGGMDDLSTQLAMKTDLGNANIKGRIAQITDQKRARYDMRISGEKIRLDSILSNPELGIFTGEITAKGQGLEPATSNAALSFDIPEVGFHQYTYTNLTGEGKINDGRFDADISIADTAIATNLKVGGEFSGKYPSIQLEGTVDSVDVMALHFSTNPLKYHGQISGDFSSTNPDSLNGQLIIAHSLVATADRRISIDTISVVSETGDTNRIRVNTGFASLDLEGEYKLTQLGDVFTNAINPYFKITDSTSTKSPDPYHFSITGNISDNPALRAVLPDLQNMEPIRLNSTFDTDSGFSLLFDAPHIHYNTMVIDSVRMDAATKDSSLAIDLSMQRFANGSSVSVYETTATGTLANNELNMAIGIHDKEGKEKYFLKGNLKEGDEETYVFSLHPDSLRLNYDSWDMAEGNEIHFGKAGFYAHDFVLKHDNESLSINSETEDFSAPINLEFSDFKISTITGMIQADSLIVGGLLNGKATVRDVPSNPIFTSDISVDDLSVFADTLGVLSAKVNNEETGKLSGVIALDGRGNDIKVQGDYFPEGEEPKFDVTLDINQFQMKSLEGLTQGAIRDARGFVYGKVRVNGSMKDKNIDGRIQFDNTAFTPAALNNVFKIDQESVAFINNQGVRLGSFTVRDTANNTLVFGGRIRTQDWTNFVFDMHIDADNFQAINSTRRDNSSFFGKLVFSTHLNVKGTPTQPIIDGDLAINDKTSFTVVLPTEDPGIVERDGIVQFVDYSATSEDSLFLNTFDSLKTVAFTGYDVSVNIDIDKKATFNLIVDPANGDFLQMRGTGQLSGGIDPSGKINLTGEYQVEEGNYSLSFNFLKRKFEIQKGSKIVWTGDPTAADVDVTAVYETNTAPLELVQGMQTGNDIYYRQKIPFEVQLKMQDELLKPSISFDIVLPDENYTVSADVINTVEQRLTQLRQEPSELNKQVFALLLMNRFIGENPFDNSNNEGMDASTLAKQSASRLLSEQLNSLAAGLIQGVDLNFDLESTEDYTTGEKQDRTNLQVGVTKRLLDDRLSVTVGNNFELEGPQQANQEHSGLADNISINYMLSKDGRYMLRAYRTNNYTGALEGYIIETGVSFIITLDYDKLSEIFLSKEEREKKKEVRQHNRSLRRGYRGNDGERRRPIRRNKRSNDEP